MIVRARPPKDELVLEWEPGKTPHESKWLYCFNGITGEYIDYENPEKSRPPIPKPPHDHL